MDYLFHQITVFILMTIYIPITIIYTIFVIKEKGWFTRICYAIMILSLIIGLPNVIKNYQQYLMGHFSGLPEVITKSQLVVDAIAMIMLTLVIISYIYVKIEVKKSIAKKQNKYMLEH